MPDSLINGQYPLEYWNLPNIDEEQGTYELWWSSEERPRDERGTVTSEYLEIDYGRKRVCNYISFDITQKPINITIEYDAWSHGDRSLGSLWIPVTPLRQFPGREDSAFKSFISYTEGTNVNPWTHAQFFFADPLGEAITTQRFRIRFERRDAEFPRPQGINPAWSIDVKNLRTARYVVDLQDARGVLIESGDYSSELVLGTDSSVEVRQNFVMPGGYVRSPQGGFLPAPRDEVITEMVPSITGIGFFAGGPGTQGEHVALDTDGNPRKVRYFWSIYNVTNGKDEHVKSGFVVRDLPQEKGWIDVLFNPDETITTDLTTEYQLRLRSLDLAASSKVFIKVGNPLRQFPNQSTANIDASILSHNNVTVLDDTAILFRIWSDIGESGKDIFGNEYREGVRRDKAANVSDDTIHTNWISGPNPDPTAVECLYFDIRSLDEATREYTPSIIDSIKVNPITPGVFMTVYYSNDNFRGNAPLTVDYPNGWEGLRWVPIIPPGHPYQLLREQTFDFPHPVRASFICLEFTSLQPLPFKLNEFPELPAVVYKKFPDSVSTRLPRLNTIQGDLLPDNEQKVAVDLFSLFKVTDEFSYRTYSGADINFITGSAYQNAQAIAAGQSQTNFGDPIDTRTLAQIYYMGTSMYYSSLPTKTDTSSVLGAFVASSYAQGNKQYAQNELLPTDTRSTQGAVSNINERDLEAYQTQAEVINPLWFPQIERHPYAVVYAHFQNQKAYFAGVAEVQLHRRDYTVERDDVYIHDVLADSQLIDSPMVDFNTWQADIPSTIPISSQVWINYQVGNVVYEESLIFEGENAGQRNFEPVLLTRGGSRAVNVQVFSGQGQTGTKFIIGTDYDIIYDEELEANYVVRNSLHYRLVSTNIKVYEDISAVIGKADISAVEFAIFQDPAMAGAEMTGSGSEEH